MNIIPILSWQNVLFPFAWIKTKDEMRKRSLKTEYSYFIWKGVVYDTITNKKLTRFIIKD